MKYRSLTYIFYVVNLCVTLIHYIKCDLHHSNSLQVIRQNHWTVKYRSLTHICLMRLTFVSHLSIIPNIIFRHETVIKMLSKITGHHKMKDTDLHIFYELNFYVTLIHYPSNSFQSIKAKSLATKYRPLTFIYFMWSIFVLHWSIISSVTFIHQIVFKI